MSVKELHDLFVNLSNFGDVHDFAKVFKEVKEFFLDDPKQNVAQYEIPEILKNLPLENETKIDPQLLDELMELDPTESDDTQGVQGNSFRRLEIVQIDHENSQIKFLDINTIKYSDAALSFSIGDEKFQL